MAIKIGGTTVISDTRALTNISNASVTGTVTATSFSGSGASLTGVATPGKAVAMAMVFGG